MHRSALRRHVVILTLLALLIGLCLLSYGNADAAKGTKTPTRVKELIEKRTANSETFLLSNGTYQAVVYSGPIHYKDANGAWQNIDTKLSKGSTDGEFRSTATPVAVDVTSALAPTVSLSYEKHTVSMSLRGGNGSVAQLGTSHFLRANSNAKGVGAQGNSSQTSTSTSGPETTPPSPPTTTASRGSVSPLAYITPATTTPGEGSSNVDLLASDQSASTSTTTTSASRRFRSNDHDECHHDHYRKKHLDHFRSRDDRSV